MEQKNQNKRKEKVRKRIDNVNYWRERGREEGIIEWVDREKRREK